MSKSKLHTFCHLTFTLEGKVTGEMFALVVTSKQGQLSWIPELQRIKI